MTTRKVLGIFLIFIIAQQICWSKSLNDKDIALLRSQDLCLQKTKYENIEPSETDKLLTPSNQLLKLTLGAFQELSLKYAKKAKNISETLLNDKEILNSNSAKILEFKQNLTQFEEKYTLCDGIDELFDLVELYSNTTSSYYELEQDSLTDDSKLILSLLRKYGSEDLDKEFEKLFNAFVDNFDKKVSDLKGNLEKEDSKESKLILEWNEKFKTLTDYDSKIIAFEKFFTFYDQE